MIECLFTFVTTKSVVNVFYCFYKFQWESQGIIHHRFARLHLVDLAGSERYVLFAMI